MSAIPQSDPQGPYGTEADAVARIKAAIPGVIADLRTYSLTLNPPFADVETFLTVNYSNPMDALGFIGHARFAYDPVTGAKSAVGLILTDNDLLRTPDCSYLGNSVGNCFFLDLGTKPDGSPASVPPCLATTYKNVGEIQVVDVAIPSNDGVQTGCYGLPVRLNGNIAETRRILYTTAKVVFVAACDTGTIFTDWWNLELSDIPKGGALVVPDITAMTALPSNVGLDLNPGNIDLEQGAIAWEAIVNGLAAGDTVQEAVTQANTAVANFYATINVWPSGKLAQVIFEVLGNQNVCPKCKIH